MTPGQIILIIGLIIHVILGVAVMYSQDQIMILTWVTTIGLAAILIAGIQMRYTERSRDAKGRKGVKRNEI